MKGLINVLYEQEVEAEVTYFMGDEDCCDQVSGQFVSNNENEPIEWKDLRVYRTLQELQDDEALMTGDDKTNWDILEGLTVDEFDDTITTDEDSCKLINLLVQIEVENNLEPLSHESLRNKIKALCPEAELTPEPAEENDLCTVDENKQSWYNFDYGGELSHQVRNEFRTEILQKLRGSTVWAPGREAECIEEIKVWYEAPDKHITSKAYTNYAAPALDWWDGFQIKCGNCITNEEYKTKNLKITELKHPFANPKKVIAPTEKSSSSSTTVIPVKNTKKTNGLERVITKDVEVETSYDVDFL